MGKRDKAPTPQVFNQNLEKSKYYYIILLIKCREKGQQRPRAWIQASKGSKRPETRGIKQAGMKGGPPSANRWRKSSGRRYQREYATEGLSGYLFQGPV